MARRTTAVLLCALAPLPVAEATAATRRAAGRGARAYRAFCATCHGTDGRGDGPTARWLDTPPRDLTRAEYRWRTTPSGSLPTDADLLRTIDVGVPGTGMPGWRYRLPERTRRALVDHVKSLSERFSEETPEAVVPLPGAPEATEAAVTAGQRTYTLMQCQSCHGWTGRGDGPSAATLKDSLGRSMEAYDLTRGVFKAGSRPEDVYRTVMTGLDGSPMPAYGDSLPEADRWPLVFYVLSLRRPPTALDYLLSPLKEQSR